MGATARLICFVEKSYSIKKTMIKANIVSEKFYRTNDGKLVLKAIKLIGTSESRSFAHMHGYGRNGFPSAHPEASNRDAGQLWDFLFSKEIPSN